MTRQGAAEIASLDGARAARRVAVLVDGRPDIARAHAAAARSLAGRADASEIGAWEQVLLALLEGNLGKPTLLAFLHLSETWPTGRAVATLLHAGQSIAVIGRAAGGGAARALLATLPAWIRLVDDRDGILRLLALLERLAREAGDTVTLVATRLERLLAMVDVDGLDAWMVSGLRATADDRGRRRAYFALDDPLAQRLLARGDSLSDFRRAEARLAAQLTALWGLRPALRPALGPADAPAPRRTAFSGALLRFPERFPGLSGDAAMTLYRAAAAHLGAHLTHTPHRFAVGTLKPLQVALVSLIEDARVEALALRAMPGLRHFWAPFHVASPRGGTAPVLLARLARALFDPAYRDDDAWVAKGRALFAQATLSDPLVSRTLGGLLGNDLGQMRVQFNPRTYVVEPAYRDDNSGLWDFPEAPDAVTDAIAHTIDTARVERRDEPQAPASDEAAPHDDTGRARPAAQAAGGGVAIATYPEWDHVLARERSDWTTIVEIPPGPASPTWRSFEAAANDDVARRVRTVARAASIGRRIREKRRSEGETLDIDAAIDAAVAMRARRSPDPRVYMRHVPGPRDLALLLLLDLSESTNDTDTEGRTVLAAERAAAEIIAAAVDAAGDPLAVHGFCSDGRHRVSYTPLKDFDEPFDLPARARLAGLRGGFSTRLGAAMRHAGACLEARRAFRRVLLLLTDGEPADIDVFDPRYLIEDARCAAQRLRARGLDVLAFGLGAGAHLEHIFGPRHALHVPRIAALPSQLMRLYARLKS